MLTIEDMRAAVERYCGATGIKQWRPLAALIDMDGVLYDSMPRHAEAWQRMMSEQGIPTTREEFFLYEGMTGAATIEMLFDRHKGRKPTADEIRTLYARKSEYFKNFGARIPIPGAASMLEELKALGVRRVLVTGSAQESLLTALQHDFPGAFSETDRVTANDVSKGKPHPEPYLKGLEIAGVAPAMAMVVENAPLGVKAGHAAGCFTVGLTTGPVPAEELLKSGADIVFPSMSDFAAHVRQLLTLNLC